ncbi:MAG: hypothetical protein ABIW48_00405, partial [Burkholderiales bacterium]
AGVVAATSSGVMLKRPSSMGKDFPARNRAATIWRSNCLTSTLVAAFVFMLLVAAFEFMLLVKSIVFKLVVDVMYALRHFTRVTDRFSKP